ncbi:WAT1-related protein At4g28040-like [Mercurialis annua]|uniref:WAT1-related protein At4g28040-like n=1 Tax=Mercurialis annua TaxID=3986 RepID=UPI00215E4938|nr:WAT1-related protein At4g28040-like [Mercurialis annua]
MGGFDDCKAVIAMVLLQFIYGGVALWTRAALVRGLNPRVFVVYRQALATLVMAPLAVFSMRKKSYISMGFKGFAWIFLASILGITANQNAYFQGLLLTSSTATTAMTNMMPAITFVMATVLGMEKLNMRRLRSIAKIIGTLICVSGAIAMALLKGPKILNSTLLHQQFFLSYQADNWLVGCILLFGSSCFWSLWIILQVPISASCPDHLYSSALMAFMATIESAIVTLYFEKDVTAWKLNSYLELGCCLYAGTAMAASFFIQAWVVSQRGPLFVAMFNPLCTVIVAIIAAIFFHEETYLGSLIGALGVIIGLYMVLWGKAKELEESNKNLHSKLQNDDSRIAQIESLDDKNCISDLEEPLISNRYGNYVD